MKKVPCVSLRVIKDESVGTTSFCVTLVVGINSEMVVNIVLSGVGLKVVKVGLCFVINGRVAAVDVNVVF